MAHSLQITSLRAYPAALCCLLFLCLAASSEPAPPKNPSPPKPATLKISGYGLLGNRQLKRMLRSVELADKRPQFLGSDTIEDAALLLTARVKSDGFLRPSITIRLLLADGRQITVQANELLDNPLPRPLRVTRANFY